jgi:hypothetical protein
VEHIERWGNPNNKKGSTLLLATQIKQMKGKKKKPLMSVQKLVPLMRTPLSLSLSLFSL